MAEALLSSAVEKLWDLLVRDSGRLHGVEDQLTKLKGDLNKLRCFIEDADAKKHMSAMVRNCVEEIKEIVFDAEDIIETFLLKEELGRSSGIRKRMRRLAFNIVDQRGIAFDMKVISKRISKVIRNMESLGVQQIIVDGSEYSHPLQERQREMGHTFPTDNESDFVGLELNVKKLVGYLVEEKSFQVISISGMGGIGKTTLAKQVFNHEMVKNHFDGVVWVCLSQQFTRKYVWKTILQGLIPKHDEHRVSNMNEEELQNSIFRLLETSKSLIVLDDIWKEEDWDIIKPVLPPGKGWKVLLTSRNDSVGLRADPTCVTFRPVCLTLEESWTLFRRIAFPDTTEFKVDVEMEEIGKKMLKHCGGLPLAVKVLGGLLAAQHTLHEWKRIYEHIKSHIVGGTSFNDRNISSVHHVLSLSFEELPISLKHCFLYLAHFPEDYPIDVENLSYYWAAEGISKPEYYERASIRDVADVYIEKLVKRNMVISERDGTTSRFETCQLHDLMREVCLLKAKEENFLQIVHGTSAPSSKSPCKSRRVAVHQTDRTFNLEEEMENPSLRSLLFISMYEGTNWTSSFSFLTRLPLMRVLDLSRAHFEGEKLPSSIGKLIHLRYLSLYMAKVTHLPSSMRNLKQLLYLNLDVTTTSPFYVPNFLKEMQELIYLHLPWMLHDKVKLELGNIVNLETLENFSTKHGSVRDLQGMTRLRTLSIDFNGGCSVETLSSSLSELRHLEILTINGENDTREFVIRDDMVNIFCFGGVQLRQLSLTIYMPRLPNVQHLPSHLTSVTLMKCRLEDDPMPILEKMLQLKEVSLWSRSFCGRKMVCSAGGFRQLEELSLWELEEWEEWIVETGSMPLLRALTIYECPKLKELPDGLPFVTSLKDLTIRSMGEEWKERVSEGGKDYHKVQHIPSIKLWQLHSTQPVIAELASIDQPQCKKGTQFVHAKEFVRHACLRLYLKNNKNLVRILASLDHSQPSGAEIVGIWGMAGIGKTFVARNIFGILAPQYDLCYFLQDFHLMGQMKGLRQMRDDFYSKVFGEEKLSISACDVKPSFMRDMFREKKILVVLDDVSNARDAEAVVGGFGWFSHGHRIILTSRKKQVLVQCKVKEPYEIQRLRESESFRLCKQYLIGESVISELISYSSGIPLAIKVLGSSVSKQDVSNMKEHLQSLRRYPPTQIREAFRRSFDELDENEKNIFLDLACFFRGENKDQVVQLLDACGFFTYLGICNLIDESLISLVDNKIEIPIPFQDIGRFIVREDDENPCERSRLWDSNDIADVLTNNSGTDAIECIFLDTSALTCELSPTVFGEMYSLRLLKLYCSTSECKLSLPQGLDTLPDELRLLHWENYPLKHLPEKFNPENLVEVNMPHSNMEKLWEGKKNLEKLKKVKLSHSRNLTDIMMLSESMNLEHIDLEGCTSLVDVSTSIPRCGKLVSLNMKDCSHLQSLPAMVDLTSLELLNLSGCSELQDIQDFAPNLKELYLAGTAIRGLALTIDNLSKLITVDLENCIFLQQLPFGIHNSRSIVELKLAGCKELTLRSVEASDSRFAVRMQKKVSVDVVEPYDSELDA